MIGWLKRLLSPDPKAGTGEWMVATGQEDGETVIVRTRTRPPSGMSGHAYPASVELVWRYGRQGTAGMPPADISPLLAECDDLLHTLEGPEVGMLGISITGNGRREWVWYVADPAAFAARARDLLATSGGRFPVDVLLSKTPG